MITVAHRSTGLPDFQGSNVLDDVQGLDRLDSAVTKPNLCHSLICALLSSGDYSPGRGRGGGGERPAVREESFGREETRPCKPVRGGPTADGKHGLLFPLHNGLRWVWEL